MGQEEPVTTYRLIARGTIEEAILKMHEEKRELALAVLEGKGTTKALGPGELLDLLRYGDD
jgi:SNF2 family DNA or RNA helicase